MAWITSLIKAFAEQYPIERQQKYTGSETTKVITKYWPEEIVDTLWLDDEQFRVYWSVWTWWRSDIPWIALLDKDITTSTKNGYYVVILFDKKTQFVNIWLWVWFTQFEEEYKKEAKIHAQSICAHYAKSLTDIPERYIKWRIELWATTTLWKGYERGQIISINHQISELTDELIYQELELLLVAYQELKSTVWSSVLNLDVDIIESDDVVKEFKKEVARKSLEVEVTPAFKELIEKANSEPPKIRIRLKREIVRNKKFAKYVKERANYICEICWRLPFKQKNKEWYAEADHVQQLWWKIKWKDSPENMRCLCSQCHSIITHWNEEEINKLFS